MALSSAQKSGLYAATATPLRAYIEALATVHDTDAESVPPNPEDHWLINLEVDTLNIPDPTRSTLAQLARATDQILEKRVHDQIPLHNDLKRPNALYQDDKVWLLDWNNLCVGPLGKDLGQWSAAHDIPAAAVPDVLKFHAEVSHKEHALDANTLQLFTALFRLKFASLWAQWDDSKPCSDYLLGRVKEDYQSLALTFKNECGLRLTSGALL